MRDQPTSELACDVNAHSLQRMVSRRQIKHLQQIEKMQSGA